MLGLCTYVRCAVYRGIVSKGHVIFKSVRLCKEVGRWVSRLVGSFGVEKEEEFLEGLSSRDRGMLDVSVDWLCWFLTGYFALDEMEASCYGVGCMGVMAEERWMVRFMAAMCARINLIGRWPGT